MFGIRTPAKNAARAGPSISPKTTERADRRSPREEPERSDTIVRRSIGEIEARTNTSRPKIKSPPIQQKPQQEEISKPGPTIGGLKLSFSQKSVTQGKSCSQKNKQMSTDMERSPTPKTPTIKYKSRTAEAKACLLKAKLQIDKSKNLKTDIKAEVLEAVERLYRLVKEAEEARPAGETPKTDKNPPDRKTLDQEALEQNTIAAQMKEQTTLLKENNKKIEELKALIELKYERQTYASVAANRGTRTIPGNRETLHSVVVTSADETETGEEVLDRVRKVVDAKEGWVTVQRVRKAKDRKVIMGFKSKDDQNKVKERLQEGNKLVVEEVKNKDPLLVLRDVLSVNTDDDVLRALRNQNRSVFHGLDG